MTDHPELHGVIRLEDQGSEALRQVAAEIHKVAADAAHAGHAISHMHHESVLTALREHSEAVGESFGRMHESILRVNEGITDLLPAFAALGAAGTIAGAFEMVAQQAEKMEALGHTAAIIGITTQQLERMHYAAVLTGTSTEAMDKGLERLNKNLAAAAHGQNKLVAAALKHAHIKLFDDHGHIRTAIDILPEFSAALRRTGNAAVRAQNAMLFMGRAGQELLPVLTMGADKQRELNEEFDREHPITDEGRKNLEEYAESLKRVTGAADGYKQVLSSELAPVFKPLVDDLTVFLEAQSKLASQHLGIGGALEREGKKVTAFLESVDWNKVGQDINGIASATNSVAEAFGGWDRAAEAVAILMGARAGLFLLGPVFAFAGGIKSLVKAVWGLSEAWRGVEAAAGAAAAVEAAAGGRSAALATAAATAQGETGLAARAGAAATFAQNRGRVGLAGLGLAGVLGVGAIEANAGIDASQDDAFNGRVKFGGAKGVPWSRFSSLPKHRGWDATFADTFGDGFAQDGLRHFLPDVSGLFKPASSFKPSDYYTGGVVGSGLDPFAADGGNLPQRSPFADPIFAHPLAVPGSGSDAAAQQQTAKLDGELTLHLLMPNMPPGTTADLTATGMPPGVQARLGSYGTEH